MSNLGSSNHGQWKGGNESITFVKLWLACQTSTAGGFNSRLSFAQITIMLPGLRWSLLFTCSINESDEKEENRSNSEQATVGNHHGGEPNRRILGRLIYIADNWSVENLGSRVFRYDTSTSQYPPSPAFWLSSSACSHHYEPDKVLLLTVIPVDSPEEIAS